MRLPVLPVKTITVPEDQFLLILRCALFKDSWLSSGILEHGFLSGLQDQLSREGAALLKQWLAEAP